MRRNRIVVGWIVLALGTALALSGCGTTTLQNSGTAPDTVTAIGTGTGSAAPDTAQISLGVTFTAKDRVTAQNGASKKADAIVAAVKAAGIDAKDIQTSQISLDQRYSRTGQPTAGFTASQSITVKTKLVDKIGAAVAAATDAGATNVSGPDFSISDTSAARTDAIGQAMADAKSRAQAMAKAADRPLGRVISVSESTGGQVVPFANYAGAAKSALNSIAPPVEPGQVESSTQLVVVFALE